MAGKATLPASVNTTKKTKTYPYWNERIKPLMEDALHKSWLYKQAGRPEHGDLAEHMRAARHKYHYAIRDLQKHEKELRKARMAECIAENNSRDIWCELKKYKGYQNTLPPHIDNKSGDIDIADVFKEKHERLYNSVPSDETVIEDIKHDIVKELESYNGDDQVVRVEDISKAISKLKQNKADGDRGLISNHVIFAPHILRVHTALLMTSMQTHGHMPDDLLKGTIVPLIKDKKGDKCDSDNYRGICLCSSLTKVYEWVLVTKYADKLCSSNLQFSFKEDHSTVNCCLTLKEVIKYYNNRGSDVYACVLDASKAFDRVQHDKLFELLKQRGIPAIALRMIMDMYGRQSSRVVWNGQNSEYFSSQNGVRQGGVASPLLFTVYIDELLKRLEKHGVGCCVGHEWYGGFGYADDLKLISPSGKGLQLMLKVCKEFGREFGVKFNARKSMCMVFTKSKERHQKPLPKIELDDVMLAWVQNVKYLGTFLSSDLSEDTEIRYKQRDFISRSNSVMYKFGYATREVLMMLVGSKCSHFYGCESWDLTHGAINNFSITWNKAIRKIWQLPPHSHRAYLVGLNRGSHALDVIYRRFINMVLKMLNQKSNYKMRFMVLNSLSDERSQIAKNMKFIQKGWNIDSNLSIEEMGLIGKKCLIIPQVSQNDDIVQCIRDFNSVIDGESFMDGFNKEELKTIIDLVSTR